MPDIIALSDLVTITSLNPNVEARKVAPSLADVHLEAEKVLGRTGYALVYATPASYAALLAYLKPWMAWRCRELGYADQYAEVERGGVAKYAGNDKSESVSGKDLGMLEARSRTRAENYLERLVEYLADNVATYTWYTTNVDEEERIEGKNAGGFILRRSERQNNYRG